MDIYAPIAHRLGMSVIKGELEDLSFRHLEPDAYFSLQKQLSDKAPFHQRFLEDVQNTIRTKLVENGIPAELEARVKGLYSLHRKIVRQARSLDQIYDLLAVRVITDSDRNCYAALGVVHHIWRPVPGRFKDYIAMARPNLYQSLHTTVLHGAQPFEVQIRTQEMHRIAEEGVAAHWKYKSGKPGSEDDDQRITWMRQLIEWSQELQEPGEFLSTLKVDLAPVEVYAFTPKGRVLELPRGATPVDFAYHVHTEVGHQCVGAKVNGQMVSLRHEIVSGDVVEILTQKGHTPSRDWLSFAKSSHARSKIRHWINLQEREEAMEMGKRLLEKEARHFGRSLKKIPEEDLLRVASDSGLSKIEDLYAAVGFGKYSARQVLTRVLGDAAKAAEPPAEDAKPTLVKTVKRMLGFGEAPLIVKGYDDLLVYRAKCCNPIPGDDIIGYITRGRGVAVHTRACPNVQNLIYQTERRIAVEWGGAGAATFQVQLMIRAKDRPGLLAEITTVISSAGSNIHSLESRPDRLNARIDASIHPIGAALEAVDVGAGTANHGGNFGQKAGAVLGANHELHLESGGAGAAPLDGDAALGLIDQILDIGASTRVHGHATATGDIADDVVAGDGGAALGAIHQQVVVALDDQRRFAKAEHALDRLDQGGLGIFGWRLSGLCSIAKNTGEDLASGIFSKADGGKEILGFRQAVVRSELQEV